MVGAWGAEGGRGQKNLLILAPTFALLISGSTSVVKIQMACSQGQQQGNIVENNAVGRPYNPAAIFKKKFMTIFITGFSFRKPGANVDLGLVREWAEPNVGVKKHRQNSKTSLLVFIRFLFAFGFA